LKPDFSCMFGAVWVECQNHRNSSAARLSAQSPYIRALT
jgi:hypothetical protein